MPFYDFECQECNTAIEVKATMAEKEAGLQVECPQCHSMKTRQVFRSLAFTGAGAGSSVPVPSAESIPGVNAACGSHCGCFPN